MSEFLAEASVLIRPDVTKFRTELQAELTAATRGVIIPVPVAPITTGPAFQQAVSTSSALSAANTQVAFTATAAAGAMQKQGAETKKLSDQQKLLKKQALEAAAAQEQLKRGILATLLSQLGIRGATLAAGQSFLIGAAAATVFSKTIQGASEDAEALADVTQVLGENLGQRLAADAGQLAVSLGIVDEQIIRFQSGLALVFKNVGLTNDATVEFSETLLQVGRDLASVKDIPVADAFRAIQFALLGNLRAIRPLIGGISAAEVRQRALADSGKELAKNLTEQELVLARFNLILEKTARFSGAWREEQERLTGSSQVLKAQVDQLADSVGRLFLPTVTDLVKILGSSIGAINSTKDALESLDVEIPIINKHLSDLAKFSLDPVKGLRLLGAVTDRIGQSMGDQFKRLVEDAFEVGGVFHDILNPIVQATKGLRDLGLAADSSSDSMLNAAQSARLFRSNLAVLQGQLLDLEFAGAGPAAQIANLQQQLAAVNAQLAKAPSGQRLGLRQQRNTIQAQIQAIADKEAADAQAAAAAIQRAVDEANRLAEEQQRLVEERLRARDQAIQDAIAQQQGAAQIRLTNAEATVGLVDDIRAQLRIRALIRTQIRVLVPQINDIRVRNQVLLELRTAEAETNAAIKALQAERRKNLQAAKEAAAEALAQQKAEALEALRLQVQIAEAEDNEKKQIAALERLIRAEEKQLAQMKKETNAKKRLRLQIAQDKAELRRLKGEAEDQGSAARDFFQFLQRQQGFGVSLLGNLFPGGAASGALGVGPTRAGGPTPPIADLFPFGAGPGGITSDFSAAAQQAAGAPRATTQGQTQTMIEILRQILRALQVQGRNTADPEARFNRASGSAVMDIM